MACVLVVDNDMLMHTLSQEMAKRIGYVVLTATTLAEGLAQGMDSDHVDIVVLNAELPDGSSLECLQNFMTLPGKPEVLLITDYGDANIAEKALYAGVWDYLPKPITQQEFATLLQQMLTAHTQRSPKAYPLQLDESLIWGTGSAMKQALHDLANVASSDVSVLIVGETGVGKGIFAKTLHANSLRAKHPYITIDCASLSETLVSSQLFGHSRGAFTGADHIHQGLLRAANKGTLFLDEVGDIPLSIQGSFLRALELRRFRPLGEMEEVHSDFRIISATNKNLANLVQCGSYREDLFFRLQGMTIHIPPLRERLDEIPMLAKHILTQYCIRYGIPCKTITQSSLEALTAYTWPGNIRELTHTLERACLVAGKGDSIFPNHLPIPIRMLSVHNRMAKLYATNNYSATHVGNHSAAKKLSALSIACDAIPSLKTWKAHSEKTYIQHLINLYGKNACQAAHHAKISRGHWYALIKKYAL